jgi:2-iminobutanoate/2-iminopropanoate deaminase
MKTRALFSLAVTLGVIAAGCGPSDEAVRSIVRDEMAAAMKRQAITNASVIGPYSPAIRAGNFLFVSGQIALDQATGTMKQESLEAETHQVLDNVMAILRSQGYDPSHVVSATVYLKNMKDYAAVNKIYAGYFKENDYPARVAVEVAALPRGANVEISVIACKTH